MSMIKNKYWKDLTFKNSEVSVDFISSLSNEAPNDDYALTHKVNSVFMKELSILFLVGRGLCQTFPIVLFK